VVRTELLADNEQQRSPGNERIGEKCFALESGNTGVRGVPLNRVEATQELSGLGVATSEAGGQITDRGPQRINLARAAKARHQRQEPRTSEGKADEAVHRSALL
jgi:hypothetical protein